jgi:hypothetical protein
VLYDGPVRVPSGAVPGNAILRVELQSSSGKVAGPDDLPITLVAKKEKKE